MKKIRIEVEFDDDKLGPEWINPDNLDALLYSDAKSTRDALKVVSFKEVKEPESKYDPEDIICECGVKLFGGDVEFTNYKDFEGHPAIAARTYRCPNCFTTKKVIEDWAKK